MKEELEENKIRKKSEWEHFQKSCLLLAGKGLEARESSREMEASKAVLKQSKSTSKKDNSLSAGAGVLAMEIDEQVEVDDCRASRLRLCGLGGGGEARGLTASNSGWLKFQVL